MQNYTISTNTVLHIEQETNIKKFAVYDQTTKDELFQNVQFIEDANVTDDKKLMEHPKENGTMVTDHIIDDPVKISANAIISDDDSSSLNEINDYYKSSDFLVIKAKNKTYDNMVVAELPYKVSSKYYDKTVYNITFKQIQEAVTQYVKMTVPQVKNPKNASTQKTGHKQAQQLSEPKPSILRAVTNSLIRRP